MQMGRIAPALPVILPGVHWNISLPTSGTIPVVIEMAVKRQPVLRGMDLSTGAPVQVLIVDHAEKPSETEETL
jgi:hypothetical protein